MVQGLGFRAWGSANELSKASNHQVDFNLESIFSTERKIKRLEEAAISQKDRARLAQGISWAQGLESLGDLVNR